ncbi:hypothetical protein PBI_TRISCUIT_93 [Microbacterium phage Triscuit]|nr:hypothetical protein PBI_TRISCUIT_93 [Microbacterium phage Triscuit]
MGAGKNFAGKLKGYVNNREGMRKDETFPIFELGYNTGLNETRDLVLTHLEDKYIRGLDRPPRGSEEAKSLLGLAHELAELLRGAKA